MGKIENLCQTILDARSDANIDFTDLRNFLKAIGFEEYKGEVITVSEKAACLKNRICNVTEAKQNRTKCDKCVRF